MSGISVKQLPNVFLITVGYCNVFKEGVPLRHLAINEFYCGSLSREKKQIQTSINSGLGSDY